MRQWFIKSDNGLTKDNFKFNPQYSYITAQLLANRNINHTQVKKFLEPDFNYLHNPFLMMDLDKAVDILIDAIENSLHIHIVGDYDQDGNSATVVLYKGLNFFTDNISFSIPSRIDDGYGISKNIIDKAKENSVDIILTCDNGISAMDEIKYAKEKGFTVIVTDHHQILKDEHNNEVLPIADAILNPHRSDCEYPFKELCGAGVAFKLIQALFDELGGDEDYLINLLQFVAMGTVCDVVDLVDENRFFVKKGIEILNNSDNLGIKKLKSENNIKKVDTTSIGFKLGPCINAAGRLDSASIGVKLFLEEDDSTTEQYAKNLVELNENRKKITTESYNRVMEIIQKNHYEKDDILLVYDDEIHESIAGIVAGRVKDYFYKPTLIFSNSKDKGILKGSARSIDNFNIIENLRNYSDLFISLGGHAMAAGFSIDINNLENLRKLLNENSTLNVKDHSEKLKIDSSLTFNLLNYNIVKELDLLEPYGKANPEPLFGAKNISIRDIQLIGKNKNVIKFTLFQNGYEFSSILFTSYEKYLDYLNKKFNSENIILEKEKLVNHTIDIVYTPIINNYMNIENIQLIIKDIR